MKIKAYMKKFKLRQKEMAKLLGITQGAISQKLKGIRKWTANDAKAIEKYTKGMVSRMEVLYPNG
uniref:Putative antitoxin n=1 Tax=viral metagenome TaxID=1070528 RepID=A0A6M3JZ50_9ZZZZ